MKITTLLVPAAYLTLGATAGWAARAAAYPSRRYLHAALNELSAAKTSLQHATHECDGYRQRTLDDVQVALNDMNKAVEYADAHPEQDKGEEPRGANGEAPQE